MERGIDSIFKELKMEYTGERFVPLDSLMKDETAFEHLHRYQALVELVHRARRCAGRPVDLGGDRGRRRAFDRR